LGKFKEANKAMEVPIKLLSQRIEIIAKMIVANNKLCVDTAEEFKNKIERTMKSLNTKYDNQSKYTASLLRP
jgi:hypothetical protein